MITNKEPDWSGVELARQHILGAAVSLQVAVRLCENKPGTAYKLCERLGSVDDLLQPVREAHNALALFLTRELRAISAIQNETDEDLQ